ncbi:MAG TPA: phage gp6-like head-tail connector protein [Pseudomonas xinjiangensis]|uniref:Phage gp6-like head-tail connector protein n=2 Tax=root TaxID=1 RepID=A0A7V1BLE5_9GAMM|nr:phage gp6-like head-tail connector protein [Halopseudomonas xinjiangensis]HEC47157.1 phage gp6-like head-tail connector protein [Halopseudomonas xinjiangensis]
MLITIEAAKAHLQMDHNDADAEITQLATEASLLVLDYLKKPAIEWQDEAGLPINVPGPVSVAVKLVLGEIFKNREAAADPLSLSVVRLLDRLREPTFA